MYGQMAVHNDFCTDIFKFCADIVQLYVYSDTTFCSDPNKGQLLCMIVYGGKASAFTATFPTWQTARCSCMK